MDDVLVDESADGVELDGFDANDESIDEEV